MDKILIVGASGHAKVVADAIELMGVYEIYGFVDSFKAKGEKVLGYEVLGTEKIIPDLFTKGVTKCVIAIGDNWLRFLMYTKIKKLVPDFEFITVIHPSAIVSKYASIGKGTVVLNSGKINADAKAGDFCIINTNSSLGHDSVMKNFSSLAPSATIGGAVRIGELSAISIGATVLQNLSIGEHTVIGAGAVVTQDICDYNIAYGVPAKIIRKREMGENYFNNTCTDTRFETYMIEDDEDLEKYKTMINALNISNPFYKTELLGTSDMNVHQLCYFVLEKNNKPVVIMPFYERDILIDGQQTSYKDVISPYGYSGPLFDKEEVTLQLLQLFWEEVDQWYHKRNIVSEFVRFSLTNNYKEYSGELIPSLKNVKGVILDEEQQWNNFKPKVRNNYRKAVQENLRIEIFDAPISLEVIKDFYDIYIQTMQRINAHDQYFFYIDYFTNFISENPNSAIIAIVYKESTPISTELILKDKDTLYSYLGGTLSDYFFTRPNDFLKIEMMKWARENDYKYYVLGGGREDGDGLYKYKKSFFPNEEDIVYYTGRKIINHEIYNDLSLKRVVKDVLDPDDIRNSYFPLYRQNE
ncbi:NeuD/PglB/VioB family sugar acetyltransferase [Aquimarina sp. 2304DJ70-9]|uniref:NeuD/PglB/VioB family sugar acetyltransferase n=1 Tax=Aquimarina penaris TaxID=3231044 RepID=UPI003462724E